MRSRHPDREFDKKDSSPLLFCPLRRIPGLSLYVSVRNCLCLSPLLSDGWMEHGAGSWSCIGRDGAARTGRRTTCQSWERGRWQILFTRCQNISWVWFEFVPNRCKLLSCQNKGLMITRRWHYTVAIIDVWDIIWHFINHACLLRLLDFEQHNLFLKRCAKPIKAVRFLSITMQEHATFDQKWFKQEKGIREREMVSRLISFDYWAAR